MTNCIRHQWPRRRRNSSRNRRGWRLDFGKHDDAGARLQQALHLHLHLLADEVLSWFTTTIVPSLR